MLSSEYPHTEEKENPQLPCLRQPSSISTEREGSPSTSLGSSGRRFISGHPDQTETRHLAGFFRLAERHSQRKVRTAPIAASSAYAASKSSG